MQKKLFGLASIFIIGINIFSQQISRNLSFGKYDSLVVSNYFDDKNETLFDGNANEFIYVTRSISSDDANELDKAIHKKTSYGSSQAMTPGYDFEIGYYKKGIKVESVLISLWTNNFFATYPLRIQRQGDCLCSRNGGYCCSNGGISLNFKKYLMQLFKKYGLPVEDDYTIY